MLKFLKGWRGGKDTKSKVFGEIEKCKAKYICISSHFLLISCSTYAIIFSFSYAFSLVICS